MADTGRFNDAWQRPRLSAGTRVTRSDDSSLGREQRRLRINRTRQCSAGPLTCLVEHLAMTDESSWL